MKRTGFVILCLLAASTFGCGHMMHKDSSSGSASTTTMSSERSASVSRSDQTAPARSSVDLSSESNSASYNNDERIGRSDSNRPAPLGSFTAEEALKAQGIGANSDTTPKGTVHFNVTE